jgi:hypothetical protein
VVGSEAIDGRCHVNISTRLPLLISRIIAEAMNDDLMKTVLTLLQRAPEWLRHDIGAKDNGVRNRAEETLAAMIEAALRDNGSDG